jgi:hypothetical protein
VSYELDGFIELEDLRGKAIFICVDHIIGVRPPTAGENEKAQSVIELLSGSNLYVAWPPILIMDMISRTKQLARSSHSE